MRLDHVRGQLRLATTLTYSADLWSDRPVLLSANLSIMTAFTLCRQTLRSDRPELLCASLSIVTTLTCRQTSGPTALCFLVILLQKCPRERWRPRERWPFCLLSPSCKELPPPVPSPNAGRHAARGNEALGRQAWRGGVRKGRRTCQAATASSNDLKSSTEMPCFNIWPQIP